MNTGRFLDPPEFLVIHAKGNEQNVFDRVDYQFAKEDSIHGNFQYTRSWFQNPNSFDAVASAQDQRAQIRTYNVAPSWTHLLSTSTLLNVTFFARHDQFNYYPSANPLADVSETASQLRKQTNLGLRSDFSYVKGIHNIKVGGTFEHTLLTENFSLGLTDPTINSPCLVANVAGDLVGFDDTTLTDPVRGLVFSWGSMGTFALTSNHIPIGTTKISRRPPTKFVEMEIAAHPNLAGAPVSELEIDDEGKVHC